MIAIFFARKEHNRLKIVNNDRNLQTFGHHKIFLFSRHIQYDSLKLDYRTTLRNKNYDKGEDNLSDGGIFAGQKNTPDGVGGDRK